MKHTAVRRAAAALLLVAAAGFLYAGGAAEGDQEIVATVNGVGIPRSFWEREVLRFEDLLRRQGQSPESARPEEVAEQALDTLVNMELLYQESRRRGIEVSEEQIAAQLEGLRQGFPSEEAFEAGLEQMGFTAAELKVELERQFAVQLLIDSHIVPGISVTEEEVRRYYDEHPEVFRIPAQVRARHILIRVPAGASQETDAHARDQIEDIRRRILAGADFAELARGLSEDGSSSEGGDLGYFSRDRMAPAFSEAAFALSPGTLSEPVRSEFGYHLIEVTDRVGPEVMAFDDVEADLSRYLHHEETMRALDNLAGELRGAATIVKNPEGSGSAKPGKE